MMTKLPLAGLCVLAGALVLLSACAGERTASQHRTATAADTTYAPQYRETWPEVRRYVQEHWLSTVATHPDLPYPFLKLTEGWDIMFYWDTYFLNRGLLLDGHFEMAKNHVDNLLHEVRQVGFVPNATAAWGRNRSQVPYLSMMVRALYEHMPEKDTAWLRRAYETLRTEYRFWTTDTIEVHATDLPGLQRFSNHATREELLAFYDELRTRLPLPEDVPAARKVKIADRHLCEAEVMDFTPRFERRCPDFAAVDLNTNLYRYEKNFAWMVRELGLEGQPNWTAKAEQRKQRIRRRLWNEERGLFMDYDYQNDRFSRVAAVSAFYPLWAGLPCSSS